jgi:hypothetical protein
MKEAKKLLLIKLGAKVCLGILCHKRALLVVDKKAPLQVQRKYSKVLKKKSQHHERDKIQNEKAGGGGGGGF